MTHSTDFSCKKLLLLWIKIFAGDKVLPARCMKLKLKYAFAIEICIIVASCISCATFKQSINSNILTFPCRNFLVISTWFSCYLHLAEHNGIWKAKVCIQHADFVQDLNLNFESEKAEVQCVSPACQLGSIPPRKGSTLGEGSTTEFPYSGKKELMKGRWQPKMV